MGRATVLTMISRKMFAWMTFGKGLRMSFTATNSPFCLSLYRNVSPVPPASNVPACFREVPSGCMSTQTHQRPPFPSSLTYSCVSHSPRHGTLGVMGRGCAATLFGLASSTFGADAPHPMLRLSVGAATSLHGKHQQAHRYYASDRILQPGRVMAPELPLAML